MAESTPLKVDRKGRIRRNGKVYTANNITEGEIVLSKNIDNPLANQDTADWLLSILGKRYKYNADERGNPAREIGDTVTIYDAYGENRDAVVIREQFKFNGKLTADTVAQEGYKWHGQHRSRTGRQTPGRKA